jgi:hypothetical protein
MLRPVHFGVRTPLPANSWHFAPSLQERQTGPEGMVYLSDFFGIRVCGKRGGVRARKRLI